MFLDNKINIILFIRIKVNEFELSMVIDMALKKVNKYLKYGAEWYRQEGWSVSKHAGERLLTP